MNITQRKALKELTNITEAMRLYETIDKSKRTGKMIYKLKRISKSKVIELFCGFQREWLGKINFDIELYRNHNYKWCFGIGFILFGLQFDFNIFEETESVCQ